MRRVPFNLGMSWLEEGTVVLGRRISQDAIKLSKPITILDIFVIHKRLHCIFSVHNAF